MQAMCRTGPRGVHRHARSRPAQALAPLRRATRRDWLYVIAQILLVAGIELSDDFFHALEPLSNAAAGATNAARVMQFEITHGFWIEPAMQRFFAQTHYVLGQAIGWAQIQPIVDTLYGQGHLFVTLFFALWVFFYRRGLFALLRNTFLLTNLLAVLLYETFPLAPPRLAPNLRYDGHSFHFLDPVFGAGAGIKLGFNEFAAMPSLHVAWALIVGATVVWATRSPLVRLAGLAYPLLMLTTVIVTGNHYVSDALGALAVVLVALVVSMLIAWRGDPGRSLAGVWRRLSRARYGEPMSLSGRLRRPAKRRLPRVPRRVARR